MLANATDANVLKQPAFVELFPVDEHWLAESVMEKDFVISQTSTALSFTESGVTDVETLSHQAGDSQSSSRCVCTGFQGSLRC